MKKVRRIPATIHLSPTVMRTYLAVFRRRKNERSRNYDEFLAELRSDGLMTQAEAR